MADERKRIIEQTASTEIFDDDWFIKDSALHNTTKISQTVLKQEILKDVKGVVELTQAEYDALPSSKLTDGILYAIKDSEDIIGNIENAIDTLSGDIDDLEELVSTEMYNTAPMWSDSSYTFDDLVVYGIDGRLYRCIVRNSTANQFVSSEWKATDIKAELYLLLQRIAPQFIASSQSYTQVYYKGNLVLHTNDYGVNTFYVCKQDLPQGDTEWVANHWEEVNTVSGLSKYLMDKIAEAGQIDDVQVDGVSVVDENKVAQITTPDADGISYDNTTSGLEADDVQEAIDEVATDIESVETALETKADVDGFYDELFAGNLLSDNTETDNAPYLYRPSPSGKSCVDLSVVGGTVAWNQLVQNPTYTSQTDKFGRVVYGKLKISGNHVFLLSLKTENTGKNVYFSEYNKTAEGFNQSLFNCNGAKFTHIYKSNADIDISGVIISRYSDTDDVGTGLCSDCQAIDLTQLFGTQIADYIYSLEQATAGSGIAWLKSYGFLTKDYYAYQSGKLESVNVSSRKIVGKNLVESTLANTTINTIGEINVSGGSSTFDMHIAKIIKGETYTVQSDESQNVNQKFVGGFFYDMPQLGSISYNNARLANTPATFTAPIDGYVAFRTSHNYAFAQIELGSTATDYEPYNPTTYPLSPIDLRGIPKLDANNNLYYDGDIYKSDGSVTRKYGVVDLGSLDWVYSPWSTDNQRFTSNTIKQLIKKPSSDWVQANVLCKIFTTVTLANMESSATTDNLIAIGDSGNISARYTASGTNATDFKQAMNGVYLVYELATPTTETAQPFTNPQLVGSTEEFVDAQTSASTPTRDVDIPVGQDSKYHTDLKAKLEELSKIPDVPSTNGTYTLKATRSASGVAYNWVSV